MPRRLSYTTLIGALLAISTACQGPTSPTSAGGERSGTGTHTEAGAVHAGDASGARSELSNPFEEFNCTDVQKVHVRFSHPGYVDGNRVGLFARYEGVPAGDKLLRVWWDRDDDPTAFRDIRLGQGEARRKSDPLFDLEVLAEHVYSPRPGTSTRRVRTELIMREKTGNCARNRIINVAPPPAVSSESAPDSCDTGRFCDLGDGTVRDNASGLVWLRNAGCFPFRRFVRAVADTGALADGQCGLADGSAPGSWRLPTEAELSALLDSRFTSPRLSNAAGDGQWVEGDAFSTVRSQAHWTSEIQDPCVGPLPGAIVVHVGNGNTRCRVTAIGFARFWPVRGR